MRSVFTLIYLCVVGIINSEAQVYPQVITNTVQSGSSNPPLTVRISSSSTTALTTFQAGKRLVASTAQSGLTSPASSINGTTTSYWYQVDVPGTSGAQTGYVAAGSTYSNPICGQAYIQVNSSASPVAIMGGSTGTTGVTIGSSQAYIYANQKFALTNGSTTASNGRYQIDLPDNCSATTGWISTSSVTTGTTSTTGLPTPTVFSSSVSSTSANINWTTTIQPTGSTNTSFTINKNSSYYATNSSLPPNAITDATLSAAQSYTYTVTAGYGSCTSSAGNTSFTTPGSSNNPPATPANFTTTASVNSVALSWNASSGATSYDIYTCANSLVANTAGTSYTVTGLTPSVSYSYKVRAVNSFGSSAFTSCQSATPFSTCTIPSAPTANAASSVTASSFQANWTSVSSATHYTLEVSTNTSFSSYVGTYNNLNVGNTTAQTISGLGASTTYYYRVRACCNTSCSGTSATNSVTTSASSTLFSVTSFNMWAWQREGDDFRFGVHVTNPNNASWFIRAKVYEANNVLVSNGTISFPSVTGLADSINTYWALPAQMQTLKGLCKSGRYVKYEIVSGNSTYSINGQTDITNALWVKQDVVLVNQSGHGLTVPLLNHQGTGWTASIQISRDNSERISRGKFDGSNISPKPYANSFSQIPLDKNYWIAVDNNSTLAEVKPGAFTYTISYYWNSIFLDYEIGSFELTKIGRINSNANSNKALVFIGGWRSDIEQNILDISNAAFNSSDSWSITKISNWTNNGLNTWYIGQPTTNYTRRNAYCIGLALDSINNIVNYSQIKIISHSKGGLDTRALLTGYALSYKESPNSYFNYYQKSTNNFSYPQNNIFNIDKVLFLATPHAGANWTATVGVNTPFPSITEGHLLASPSLLELSKETGYKIIDVLNSSSSKVPQGIEFANLTVYHGTSSAFLYHVSYDIGFQDGVVAGESSDCISTDNSVPTSDRHNLLDVNNSLVSVLQMYQHNEHSTNLITNGDDVPHLQPHKNYCLTTLLPYPFSKVNQTTQYPNILKLVNFITGASITPNCPRPTQSKLNIAAAASILSGAAIYRKIDSDVAFYQIGWTGENGQFLGNLIPAIGKGDSIRIDAPGYEALTLGVDSVISKKGKIRLVMLKSNNPTGRIKYPRLTLFNQNPITNSNSITLNVSGQNVLGYQINIPFNQDTAFGSLSLTGNSFTAQLDTGYNLIIIKFIGQQDTILLAKEVYYLPDTLLNQYTYGLVFTANTLNLGTKVYVNNQFVKEISSLTDTIQILKGRNVFSFSKFGYVDSLVIVDSSAAINISSQLFPASYSSLTDSSQIDFTQNKIRYWKTVTVMDSAMQSIISIQQYNDSFTGSGLIPKSRKFEFRHLNTAWSTIHIGAVRDEIENYATDSVYLAKINNGTAFTKIPFDTAAIVASYDSTVQKFSYNYLNFDSGTVTKQAFVIMKKQPPISTAVTSDTLNQSDSLVVALSRFFTDPDTIHHDISYQVTAPSQFSVYLLGDSLVIKPAYCWNGTDSFTLQATHDWLSRSKTIKITINPAPRVTLSYSRDSTLCNGDSIILSLSPAASYLWSNGATTDSIVVKQLGHYRFRALLTDIHGCQDSVHSDSIRVQPLPLVGINYGITTFCKGGSVTFQTTNAAAYLWSNGDTTQSITVRDAGNYNIILTSVYGCKDSLQRAIPVTVHPLPVASISTGSAPTTICADASDTLTAYFLPKATYTWNNGKKSTSIIVNTTGDYYVIVRDSFQCVDSSPVLHITVNPLPVIKAVALRTAICMADTTLLVGTGAERYKWEPATGLSGDSIATPIASPGQTTSYTVTGTDANGCKNKASLSLIVNSLPKIITGKDTTIASGDEVQLGGSPTASGNAPFYYTWIPALGLDNAHASNPTATPADTTTYRLTVRDKNGCISDSEVTIKVVQFHNDLNLEVHPIPTTGVFEVSGHKVPEGDYNYILVNAAGQRMDRGTYHVDKSGLFRQRFDISGQAAGTYIVKVWNGASHVSRIEVKID